MQKSIRKTPEPVYSPVTACYPEVRALERGLKLVEALAKLGWCSPVSLAADTGLDRTTIYRLLATLGRSGYVEQRSEDGRYILSDKVAEIASGIRADDGLARIISPVLADLVRRIHWPSDFAMFSGGSLRIAASSHHLTSMSVFRGLIGKSRSMLNSALGRAILAAISPGELAVVLSSLSHGEPTTVRDAHPDVVNRMIEDTRKAGYASAISSVEDFISAIALPVRRGDQVVGAINLVFFRSAMSPEQAAEQYLRELKGAVATVEARLRTD